MAYEIIRLRSVSKRFGDIEAVHPISLVINEGETFGLIGTSGSGKTTTLRMINRLIEPSSGSITINGEDILDQDPVRLRRSIGYMIQNVGLFPHYTIGENIAIVPRLLNWKPDRIKETVHRNLTLVGLEPERFMKRYPHELSGGQQQRTGLARALAADPPIILLDEPFAASDPISRADLINEFKKLRSRVKKTMVLVTHDIPEAFELCDRMALLDEGFLQQTGTREDLLFRPDNEFVQNFFDSHRLSLEISITTLAGILPYLVHKEAETSDLKSEYQVDQSIGTVLNKISTSSNYGTGIRIRLADNKILMTDEHDLLEALLKFRSRQRGADN
ncbi:MAG TPA: ATP-binding cassette domain-containing protein [Balneolales bacterium]|nr:ATP-binding cassette domain-containing protein [Balneolales bacterium]